MKQGDAKALSFEVEPNPGLMFIQEVSCSAFVGATSLKGGLEKHLQLLETFFRSCLITTRGSRMPYTSP